MCVLELHLISKSYYRWTKWERWGRQTIWQQWKMYRFNDDCHVRLKLEDERGFAWESNNKGNDVRVGRQVQIYIDSTRRKRYQKMFTPGYILLGVRRNCRAEVRIWECEPTVIADVPTYLPTYIFSEWVLAETWWRGGGEHRTYRTEYWCAILRLCS